MTPLKRDAASLMGISPRALSHYLTKYDLISTRVRAEGENSAY
jgi:hypothetical protein